MRVEKRMQKGRGPRTRERAEQLAPFSISLVEIVAELVKPPSAMELWVVKFTTSEELEQAE